MPLSHASRLHAGLHRCSRNDPLSSSERRRLVMGDTAEASLVTDFVAAEAPSQAVQCCQRSRRSCDPTGAIRGYGLCHSAGANIAFLRQIGPSAHHPHGLDARAAQSRQSSSAACITSCTPMDSSGSPSMGNEMVTPCARNPLIHAFIDSFGASGARFSGAQQDHARHSFVVFTTPVMRSQSDARPMCKRSDLHMAQTEQLGRHKLWEE